MELSPAKILKTLDDRAPQEPSVHATDGPAGLWGLRPPAVALVPVDDEIRGLAVDVSVSHRYKSDLRIGLRAPDGMKVELHPAGTGAAADDIEELDDAQDLEDASSFSDWKPLVAAALSLDDGSTELLPLQL